MNTLQRLMAATAIAALATAAGGPALADDAGPAVAEIVVTAQKRAENVQDVPISMEVVSAKKLEAFHTDGFKALSVPNMNTQAVGGNDVIYMRGFGSPSQNYAFDQAVSLYVDGIYGGRSRQFMAPFFDLQRIEVLRGPQGALFGKNTAAGAISIISAQPTRDFEGSVTGIYNFDQEGYELSGYVSGPITEALSARLAAKVVDKDGYIDNKAPGGGDEPTNEAQLARLTVKYQPNDKFDYVAKAEYSFTESLGNGTVSGLLTGEQKPVEHRYAVDDPALGPAGFETLTWNVSGTGNLQLGEFTLTSITGYSYFNASHVNNFDQTIPGGGLAPPSVFNSFPEHFNQWSQEFRLQSPIGGKLEYIIGAYYDKAEYQAESYNRTIIAGLGNFLSYSNFNQDSESYSIFGQGVYHVTDDFRVQGSLRYSHTEKDGSIASKQLQGPFPLRPLSNATGDISEGEVDPSVTLQYDINRQTMVYATYGQGSKSGGFVSNSAGTKNATFTFKPEHSENFELGVKTTLADGALVLNGAVYKTKFDDLQVSTYNPNVQAFLVGNAAKASSTGVEGAATWYPVRNLDITASAAYQDVEYDDYPGAQCLASQPITQCNPAVPASVAANNLAGYPLPNISKFSGNVQVHYVAELSDDLRIGATGALSGRSKFFNSDDQSPLYGRQKAYAKLDARIELYQADSKWHVALVGTNLTDELTTEGSFRLPAPVTTVPRALYWVNPGRNISLEAGVKF